MDKDASTLRQEIEQTRERMGDTVEALAYKTDVAARAKDSVNDRVEAVRETIGNAVDRINSAVTGTSRHGADTLSQGGNKVNSAMNSISTTVSNQVSDLNTTVSNGVSGLNDAVSSTVGGIRANVGERLANGDMSGKAQRAVGMVQENPIGLALVALAVGFLGGSLIPTSDIERERLGPIREKVAQQAQAAAGDLVAAGKAVVAETAQSAVAAAMTSAQSHSQDVVDAAKARADQI
jgi:hypothetical protein